MSSSVISVVLLCSLCAFFLKVRQLCICENWTTTSELFVLPVTAVNIEKQNDSSQAVAGHVRAFTHVRQTSCPVFPSGNLKHVSAEISDPEWVL